MSAKIAVTFFTFAAAASAHGDVRQCNTGNAQCCNQVHQVQSAEAKNIVGNIVGLDIGDIITLVGAECSPLTVVGAMVSGNCNSNAVCCSNNKQSGLVNVDCVPIQL